MKNLIVQVDIPGEVKENKMHGYYENLYDNSKERFMQYAKKNGADYLCIHTSKYPLHATYERFQIFGENFDCYDMILYVDCDIIPTKSAPNIFAEYSDVAFAAFSEGSVFYGNNKELQKEFNFNSRMENILKIVGMEDRLIDDISDLEKVKEQNYEKAYMRLNKEKQKSKDFLKNALKIL